MNRSILIVLIDFLLVMLLAFSTLDTDEMTDKKAAAPEKANLVSTNQAPDSGKDLAAAMRSALEDERKGKDQLQNELARLRDAADKQQSLLSQREGQIQNFQQQLQSKEQETARLQQQQQSLQQQYAAAQTNLQNLNQQLQSSSTEAVMSKEKLAAMEAEARKQAEQAAALQQQLAALAKSNQMVLAEKQQLSTQLQVAETEKRYAAEHAARMQEEVKIEREEKAKLAENVKVLASKSSELAQEVRENRPLAPNAIYNELSTNHIQASFTATRTGLLGIETNKRKATQTVLVSNGTNTFALCHVQDTPLTLWNPGTDWDSLVGSLSGNSMILPIRSLAFHRYDPRVVLMPVSDAEAKQLGCKVYRITSDPFKFQDAVLIGTRDSYYGECKFEIDPNTPYYVKLDRSLVKGIFGKFNPSTGDLVFSKNGEFVGIMVNGTYCLLVQSLNAAASLQFADDVRDQHTGRTLSQLFTTVFQMPLKLQ